MGLILNDAQTEAMLEESGIDLNLETINALPMPKWEEEFRRKYVHAAGKEIASLKSDPAAFDRALPDGDWRREFADGDEIAGPGPVSVEIFKRPDSFAAQLDRFPEVRRLDAVVENNKWHKDDNELTHTENVYEKTQEALNFDFITDPDKREAFKNYFAVKVDEQGTTRGDVLKLAALLHDISKADPDSVDIQEETGHNYFPGHDVRGAGIARGILENRNANFRNEKFDGDFYEPAVIDRVDKLIRYHLEYHLTKNPEERSTETKEQRRKNPEIFADLLVLSMADMQGSHLDRLIPDEFKERMKHYHRELNAL